MGAGASQLKSEHLTKEQLAKLQRKFARLSGGDGMATIEDLQRLPELAGNPLIVRMFEILDTDGDRSLNLQEFLKAVEWFGSMQRKEDMYMCAFRYASTVSALVLHKRVWFTKGRAPSGAAPITGAVKQRFITGNTPSQIGLAS
jgi:hypothetical protein